MRRETQLTSSARFYERKLRARLWPSGVCTACCHSQKHIIDEVIPRVLRRMLKLADPDTLNCLNSKYYHSSPDRNAPLSYNPILTRHAHSVTYTTRLRLLSTSSICRLSRSSGKFRCIFVDCCAYFLALQ